MLLKRLEINGFKSFATKTVFDFGVGISGIVGPNGSGKSNVIDAIRWLLGEREAKNLRGAKIEDLIFAGSVKKPRMSQAQVSLVFDNTRGTLPVDFKEVVITRKISRSGESEYYINDAAVRLKDVIDFFSKIKLGTKGLTIIGQGSGDIFVKALPQDRMMMVQEILGLREYQLKKAEAQRKLKHTKINLEKIQAMIQEVGPRLRMLKRQTARWEKRFEIEQRLEEIDLLVCASRIFLLTQEAHRIAQPRIQLEASIARLETQEAHNQQTLTTLEQTALSGDALRTIQEQKRTLFEKKSEYERSLYALESDIARHIEKTPHGSISLSQAQHTLQEIRTDLSRALELSDIHESLTIVKKALARIEALYTVSEAKQENQSTVSVLQEKQKHAQELLQACLADIARIEQEEQTLSENVSSFQGRFKEAYAQLEATRKELRTTQDHLERVHFDLEKNRYKHDELRNYINSIGKSYETYEHAARSESFEPIIHEHELADKEREAMRLRGELSAIGEIDEALIKEEKEVEAHYAYLTKESTDLEQASQDLFLLIHELDEKITHEFHDAFKKVNEEFNTFFRLMFGGGSGKMKVIQKESRSVTTEEGEPQEIIEENDRTHTEAQGIDIELSIPQKKITSLEMLSGGEKSLVSLAVLFALISVSPPPFLVLDEVDSALDEKNSRRFSELVKTFAHHSQFVVVTHNRVTMEAADVLYGVTMDEGGGSKVLSLKMV